jgi:pimeloyl-ACP methyl ester carboxylesterase
VRIADGRKLYLECHGNGAPAVVLEAGLRVRSDYWGARAAPQGKTAVLPGVAAFTHVCAYDRPGTVIGTALADRSRSDPVPMPRTATSAVDDLHALTQAAQLPRPFVLAGHSTGGILTLLYAHRFPNDVAGLVLVDSLADLSANLTRQQYATFLRLNTEVPKSLQSYKAYETIPFDPAFAELHRLQAHAPLARMPLVVVTRGLPVALPAGVPAGFSMALERAWRIQQANLVRLEPGARQIVATKSGHYVMLQQPDVVIAAIRDVVDAVRRKSALPP